MSAEASLSGLGSRNAWCSVSKCHRLMTFSLMPITVPASALSAAFLFLLSYRFTYSKSFLAGRQTNSDVAKSDSLECGGLTPPCPPCCLRRAPLRQDRRLHSSILSQYQGGVKPPHSKVPSAQKLPQWCLTGSAILRSLGSPDKQNAHFREVSGNSDHGRAACPQRAVDFAQRYG